MQPYHLYKLNIHALLYFSLFILICLTQCSPKTSVAPNNDVPHRLVALTPSIAETLCAMGFEDKLVAASRYTKRGEYCHEYIELQSMPADLEAILALKPDLVLAHPSDSKLAQSMHKRGILFRAYAMDSIESIKSAATDMAELLGEREKAEAFNAKLQTDIDEITQKHDLRKSPSVVLVVEAFASQRSNFYIAQHNAYLAECAKLCGARVLSHAQNDWQLIEAETLIQLDPDLILHFAPEYANASDLARLWREKYPRLRAIQNDGIRVFTNPRLSLPGPNLGLALQEICHNIAQL
ncbi:MAG: helical backbone metal receptor [Bradymonadales bacterium]|jgi:iron complex transport system substrate-binding protein